MTANVVVTGVGIITPLGASPHEVLARIDAGQTVAAPPSCFDAGLFACPVCAEIADFYAEQHVPEPKTLRLMNRDALLAVAAARNAMRDAGITIGEHYPPEDVALFGATGLAGVPLGEVARLIQASAAPDGRFDPTRFGAVALKQVRPVLSFKILSNMPICFVSIFERLQGPNAVYNPWEGQGAQAIVAGADAVWRGEVPCALVGGCDVKTHELSFIAMQQNGVFRSWHECGSGPIPGEGAAFLVLEDEERARSRGARVHARLSSFASRTAGVGMDRADVYAELLSSMDPGVRPCGTQQSPKRKRGTRPARSLACASGSVSAVVSAGDGDVPLSTAEQHAMDAIGLRPIRVVRPKAHLGNLFAAAAAAQVALAAVVADHAENDGTVLANCFGYGSEQAAFVLEKA
jgi:3-oxoacyl-[acyl-carrier-protein] synthase II